MEHLTRLSAPWTDSRPHPRIAKFLVIRSKVKSLITNNALCIEETGTTQKKQEFVYGYGLADAPPVFQAGWSDSFFFPSFFDRSKCSYGISV
jgi:hypothetical protein